MTEAAWRLVSDIGGTNVRFGRAGPDGAPFSVRAFHVGEHVDFASALDRYLAETGGEGCVGAAIGAAGPVDEGVVQLTNAPWVLREGDISRHLAGSPVRIVNDLEAVAHALPHLGRDDLAPLGPVTMADRSRPLLALNIGTGFGAASIAATGSSWFARPSEAGHMSLVGLDDAERAALAGCDTVEDLLSGRGVVALYDRLSLGRGAGLAHAGLVLDRAATDPAAGRAVELVTGVLGRVAGDLVLATGAWGGCLFCGSVAASWALAADIAAFRTAFERKGPMSARMAQVYTGLITRGDIALYGLARMPLER
jgi:glucokinase